MMTRSLVALAAAFAAQVAFLHAAVAAPLSTALGELREPARAATFEETITVVATPAPAPATRS